MICALTAEQCLLYYLHTLVEKSLESIGEYFLVNIHAITYRLQTDEVYSRLKGTVPQLSLVNFVLKYSGAVKLSVSEEITFMDLNDKTILHYNQICLPAL